MPSLLTVGSTETSLVAIYGDVSTPCPPFLFLTPADPPALHPLVLCVVVADLLDGELRSCAADPDAQGPSLGVKDAELQSVHTGARL